MSDSNAPPIAGWYPDPENEAGDRWWNGVSWSDQHRARTAPAKGKKAAATTAGATAATPAIPVPPVAPDPDRPNPYAASTATYPGAQPYTGGTAAPPYAPTYASRTPMLNTVAFAGMITSLASLLFNWFLFGLPGLVGGCISIGGLVKANGLAKAGVIVGHGRGFAIAGIITGFGGALLWDLFYFTLIQPFPSS